MKKVVYIAGMGHCGSTVLDMSLGSHPLMIGLGEIKNLLYAEKQAFNDRFFTQILCSCGKGMNDCEFWSGASKILMSHTQDTIEAKIKIFIDYFDMIYGNDMIMVDSSKSFVEYLHYYSKHCQLYVIFLIRDIRSWVYSRKSRHGKSLIGLSFKWFKRNFKIKQLLDKTNINYIKVGYEELSLFPGLMLGKICEFIGISYNELMLVPGNTKSHIIRGNVARGDQLKTKGFYYDARWFTSLELAMLTPALFPVLKWNNDNVYSNFVTGKTNAFSVGQKDFIIFSDKRKEELVGRLKETK